MNASNFLTIAHRGASAYAPENTYAAFDLALEMGARHIEFDVHSTVDGHAAVIHDDTLDRTTSGSGLVVEHSLAELEMLDVGLWFHVRFANERIPVFADVLERYAHRAHLHVEIKTNIPGYAKHIVNEIREQSAERQVTITAFKIQRLMDVRNCAPDIQTGWLVGDVTDETVAVATRVGISQLCPKAGIVTEEMVQCLHESGFVVRVWGVRSEAEMRRMVHAGADGMTIDYPDKLLQYLAQQTF